MAEKADMAWAFSTDKLSSSRDDTVWVSQPPRPVIGTPASLTATRTVQILPDRVAGRSALLQTAVAMAKATSTTEGHAPIASASTCDSTKAPMPAHARVAAVRAP